MYGMGYELPGVQAVSHPHRWWRPGARGLGTILVSAVSVALLLWVAPPASVRLETVIVWLATETVPALEVV